MKIFSASTSLQANTFMLLLLFASFIKLNLASSGNSVEIVINQCDEKISNQLCGSLLLDNNLGNRDSLSIKAQSANEKTIQPNSPSESTNQESLNYFILQLPTINTSISDLVKPLTSITLNQFHIFIRPTLYGLCILWFSWLLIYFDSKVPGVYPPSPISPSKHKKTSGHTFHLNYAIVLINGLMTFCLTLWQQLAN